jgi:hypothetical protein
MTSSPTTKIALGIGIAGVSALILVASGCGLMSWPALRGVGGALASLGTLLFVLAALFTLGVATVEVISWLVGVFRKGDS